MADCNDLVNAVISVNQHVDAVSTNIDALRQEIYCMRDFLIQALPTAEFWARAAAGIQNSVISGSDGIAQQINHQTTILSGTETPSSEVDSVNIIDESDLGLVQDCGSTLYCPPGWTRNEFGVCVPPE